MFTLYGLRFRYRDFESRYNSKLIEAMYEARTPGGASATLKSIPGLVDNLGRLIGMNGIHADWDQIQTAIYHMQAEILEDLGQPTQVTPYAANTTGQAALSLWHRLEGRDKYHLSILVLLIIWLDVTVKCHLVPTKSSSLKL